MCGSRVMIKRGAIAHNLPTTRWNGPLPTPKGVLYGLMILRISDGIISINGSAPVWMDASQIECISILSTIAFQRLLELWSHEEAHLLVVHYVQEFPRALALK